MVVKRFALEPWKVVLAACSFALGHSQAGEAYHVGTLTYQMMAGSPFPVAIIICEATPRRQNRHTRDNWVHTLVGKASSYYKRRARVTNKGGHKLVKNEGNEFLKNGGYDFLKRSARVHIKRRVRAILNQMGTSC